MSKITKLIICLFLAAILLGACGSSQKEPSVGMANPASTNCVDKGGTLITQKRGDGGEYGICTFDENRQCEEWAMMNGDCPVGGLKITGYITTASQYCAITGGEYAVTGESGAENEQGTCAFKNGKTCDVWEYFNGKCEK